MSDATPDRDEFGPKILNGELRYVSSSCMKTFDPRHFAGCPRQWAYRYIANIRPESDESQKIGTAMHERIEHYLKSGENVLAEIERAGRVWIPKPSPQILIEHAAIPGETAPVVEGVAVVTKIDAMNLSNYYIDPEGETHVETFPEVIDWKSSSNIKKWGMTADGIRDDVAMNAYGLYTLAHLERHPTEFDFETDRVRLSHVYFGTRRREADKRTAIVPVERLVRKLEGLAPLIREMQDVTRTTTPDTAGQVECNTDACTAYRGCKYQDICIRPKSDAIRLIMGSPEPAPIGAIHKRLLQEQTPMSITDKLLPPPSTVEPLAPVGPDVVGLVNRLRTASDKCGYGFPQLVGDARDAAVKARAAVPGPAGRLAGVEIDTVAALLDAVQELELAANAKPAAAGVAPAAPPPAPVVDNPILPPDAAAPNPVTAALPLPPEETITLAPVVAEHVAAHPAQNVPPPAAKPGRPASEDSHLKNMKKPELVAHALELEKRLTAGGSAPASDDASAARIKDLQSQLAAEIQRTTALEKQIASINFAPTNEAAPDGIHLYVDAVVDGAKSLDPYIDRIAAAAVARDPNAVHLLCATNDSPLAFGKWRGVLASMMVADPPEPGAYTLLGTFGNEVKTHVADVLRPLCSEFVRGVK